MPILLLANKSAVRHVVTMRRDRGSRAIVFLCATLLLCGIGCRDATEEREEQPPASPAPAQPSTVSAPADPIVEEARDVEEPEATSGSVLSAEPSLPAESVPSPAMESETRNDPPIALYVSDRLQRIDTVMTFRVHAEAGEYFNCYYSDRRSSYHHVRLRGDGAAYLDGYLPRDPAGEQLWLRLQKNESLKLTVKVVMRPETIRGICNGQVEVLDSREGWDYSLGGVSEPGALQRRWRNNQDRRPARNRPAVQTIMENAERYVDRELSLRVRGRIDRQYQCRYRDAERSHYSVFLQGDSFRGLRGYVRRNPDGRRLVEHLARNEGGRLSVKVMALAGRHDPVCPDQVEVVGWRPGWEDGL